MINVSRKPRIILPSSTGITRAPLWMGLGMVLILGQVAGCGTGTYNERMKTQLGNLEKQSKFLELLDRQPYEVSDPDAKPLGVYLRLPKGLANDGQALRMGYKDEDDLPIDERRIQPPFLKLRDFCLSYELFVKDELHTDRQNYEMPVYGYFAVTDAKSVEKQELLDEIRQALAEQFAENPAEWDINWEPSPPEASVSWQRIRVAGPQLFDCVTKGGEFKPFEGRFDVYVYSDDTYHVVIAWRAPVVIDDQIHWMEAGETSLATLTVVPPPPEPDQPPADPAAAGDGSS